MTTIINPTSKAVSDIADFDHVFAVWHSPDGVVAISDDAAMAPELHEIGQLYAPEALDPDTHATTLDGWELPLSGFTGQYGYAGPWLHDSEVIEGGVGEYVLEHPGYWVAIYGQYSADLANCWCPGDPGPDGWPIGCTCEDPQIEGWTLAYKPFTSTTQQNGEGK